MSNLLTLTMVVSNVMDALDFYEEVFAGERKEVYYFPNESGVNEGNMLVGGMPLRLIDENNDYDCFPPKKDEIDSIWLQIMVANVDATLEKAQNNGALVKQTPTEFMGVRHGEILDPFGYVWTINQVIKELSFEERYKIYEELQKK